MHFFKEVPRCNSVRVGIQLHRLMVPFASLLLLSLINISVLEGGSSNERIVKPFANFIQCTLVQYFVFKSVI